MTSLRYIKAGLDTTEAMVLASFIGWQMALANVADTIGKDIAVQIAGDAGDNIKALMLDETLEWGENKVALVGTETGELLADLLAASLHDIANTLKSKETENAAV